MTVDFVVVGIVILVLGVTGKQKMKNKNRKSNLIRKRKPYNQSDDKQEKEIKKYHGFDD